MSTASGSTLEAFRNYCEHMIYTGILGVQTLRTSRALTTACPIPAKHIPLKFWIRVQALHLLSLLETS